jgi:hypothetical protein
VPLGGGLNKRSYTEGQGATILLPKILLVLKGALGSGKLKGLPRRPARIAPGLVIVLPLRSRALPFRRIRFPGRVIVAATLVVRAGAETGTGKWA